MKPLWTIILLLLGVATLLPACKKNNKEIITCPPGDTRQVPTVASLLGNWKLTGTKIGIGGVPTDWAAVNYNEIISWADDNTFITADKSVKRFQLTSLPGDTLALMKYYTKGQKDTVTMYLYMFDNELVLYGGQCTEGCFWKYNRIYVN